MTDWEVGINRHLGEIILWLTGRGEVAKIENLAFGLEFLLARDPVAGAATVQASPTSARRRNRFILSQG